MKRAHLKVLLIIITTELILTAYSYFFPKLNLSVFGYDYTLNFPDVKNIAGISKTDNKIKNIRTAVNTTNKKEIKKAIKHTPELNKYEKYQVDSLFINPQTNDVKAMDNFYGTLLKEKDKSLIRIAHFGDSQIEGDRITYYIRAYLQAKFGGYGIGYVPIEDIATNQSVQIKQSKNWKKYTVFHDRNNTSNYGLSGLVFKTKEKSNTYINYKLSKNIKYDNITLLCGTNSETRLFETYNPETKDTILEDTLKVGEGFTIKNIKTEKGSRNIYIEFKNGVSADIYGINIDSKTGIQVDNYAIRGHSGDGLLLIDPIYLREQIQKLNTRLIIFQYGANVLPYIKNEKECEWIEKSYYHLFGRFKIMAPDASIIVIGNGDMATYEDGEYKSYTSVKLVNEAIRRSALKAGCAYWDLLKAQGGENSILKWVRKGYASYDGHLTPTGQKIIAKLFCQSIIKGYENYNKPPQSLASK